MLHLIDAFHRVATCVLKGLDDVEKNRADHLHPKGEQLDVPLHHFLVELLSGQVLKLD